MNDLIDCFEKLNEFYNIDYDLYHINCEDSNNKRKETINKFSKTDDKIQLLFNIRILNECIDIPECDSIYISYPPKNKITTIQRINRATRIDNKNPYKIANIYIWCNEYDEILETLSTIKEFDIFFKDKIKINSIDFYNNKSIKDINLIENDKEIVNNYIIGIKEFKQYSWEEKLNMVENYIKENGKLPSVYDKIHKYKQLGVWIHDQKHHYKNYTKGMKKSIIRELWELFMEKNLHFFRTKYEIWEDKLNEIKEYIIKNNKLPSTSDKNENIKKIGSWISRQKQLYIKFEYIMNNEFVRKLWENFVEDNSELFYTNEELWYHKLNKLKTYIGLNKKLPSINDENKEINSLYSWMRTQKTNYVNMKNENIKNIWEQFINQYANLFMLNEEIWYNKFNTIIEYIENNNTLPSRSSLDVENKKMGEWIQKQKQNYKNKTGVMNLNDIRFIWEHFLSKYDKYKTNEDKWFENFEAVKEYVKQNKQLPSREYNRDKNIQKLANWVNTQKQNYKNKTQIFKNSIIFKLFDEFVNENYDLFKTNEELWMDNYNELLEYIKFNNKLPSKHNENENIKKLGIWISRQKQLYENKENIMNNDEFRIIWKQFIEKNYILFESNEQIWYNKLNQLKKYIENNQKLPSNSDKDKDIKALANWIQTQKENFQLQKHIMSFEYIRKEWEQMTSKHIILFMTREELWEYKLKNLSEYIETHKKLPSIRDDNENVKYLANFMYTQNTTYKNNTKIMKNNNTIKKNGKNLQFIMLYI